MNLGSLLLESCTTRTNIHLCVGGGCVDMGDVSSAEFPFIVAQYCAKLPIEKHVIDIKIIIMMFATLQNV